MTFCNRAFGQLAAVVALLLLAGTARAVTIDWVTVGDVGNHSDAPLGADDDYGRVSYVYRIAKYEVTNGQYREFLGAVAAVGDRNRLYNFRMAQTSGGIDRWGSGTVADPFVYTANDGDAGWDDKPVNYVSYYDALRFANWLHNDQPTGQQDATTTEEGAYSMRRGFKVKRTTDAQVFLPDIDEWYKAAYYKGGGTTAGYWDYATQSDTAPTAEPPPGIDTANGSANYSNAVGAPYNVSDVGAYDSSPSAYGTFDQNGNVSEWNEVWRPFGEGPRPHQAGSYRSSFRQLRAFDPASDPSTFESDYIGFRVASIPEPGTASLLIVAAVVLLAWGAARFCSRRISLQE